VELHHLTEYLPTELRVNFVTSPKKGQKTPDGYYNIERMLKRFTLRTHRILLCGSCMDARGLAEADLVEGAQRSTMGRIGAGHRRSRQGVRVLGGRSEAPDGRCGQRLASSRRRMNRQARDPPFGKSILKTTRPITPLTERRDGLERQDAPRAPAICYNLSIRRMLRQPPFQLRQRYIQRPGQMALLELVLGTDIDDCRRPGSQPIQQLYTGDRLELVTGAEVGVVPSLRHRGNHTQSNVILDHLARETGHFEGKTEQQRWQARE
jgi:hypothetical protein